MKVIKKGRPQRGWAKRLKCTGEGNNGGGCGAILLVEQVDLYQTSSSSMGEVDYFATFCCSECGVETDVPKGTSLPVMPTSLPRKGERQAGRQGIRD